MIDEKHSAESIAAGIIAEIKSDETRMECKNLDELQNHCGATILNGTKEFVEAVGIERAQEIMNAAKSEVNLWLVAKAIECKPHWNSVDMDAESHSAAFQIKHNRRANWETEETLCDELWFDDTYRKIRLLVEERTGK